MEGFSIFCWLLPPPPTFHPMPRDYALKAMLTDIINEGLSACMWYTVILWPEALLDTFSTSLLGYCRVWSLYCVSFPMCAMNRAISYISMDAAVIYIIKDQYSSNTLISLGKGTKRHSNCCIAYTCPCGWFAFNSWGSSLNSGLLCCGQMDLIFLTFLELDCPLGNCSLLWKSQNLRPCHW